MEVAAAKAIVTFALGVILFGSVGCGLECRGGTPSAIRELGVRENGIITNSKTTADRDSAYWTQQALSRNDGLELGGKQ